MHLYHLYLKEFLNLIEKNRQSFSSSVIKKVKYLVVGDNPSKTKIDRAKTLNIYF